MDSVGVPRDHCFNRVYRNIGNQYAKRISRGCPAATRFEGV